jgi:perosamine synthetase
LAVDSLHLEPDDEVILPTYTFTATAEVVAYYRARPVLVDVNPITLNVDPAAVEAAISPRTRAIISVDMAGVPCDYDAILDVAGGSNLPVIDDAAHALPSSYRGRNVGTIVDMTAFSFYATKTLATGEGGMLVTDDPERASRAAVMSLHGMNRDAWKRYTSEGSWYYEVVAPGFKYNLTDVAAAIGLCQLARQDELLRARRRIADRYQSAFADIHEIETPTVPSWAETSWHLYVLRLNLERLTADRATFVRALGAENVGTSVHFIPLHRHPWYREAYGYGAEQFPVADAEFERVLSLPLFPTMTDGDVDDVIAAVRKVVAAYRR